MGIKYYIFFLSRKAASEEFGPGGVLVSLVHVTTFYTLIVLFNILVFLAKSITKSSTLKFL
jgi:hypothetical protein